MRALSLVFVPFLAAGTLAAQAPESRPRPLPPAATLPSLWFDAGALLEHQIRAGFEAVTLGRATLGVSVTYDDRAPRQANDIYPLGYAYPQTYMPVRDPIPCADPRSLALCAYPQYYPYNADTPRYRAWSFNASARYYPRALAFRNGPRQMMVYAGGFVGFHWRVTQQTQPYYYNPPMGTVPPPLSPRDSVIIVPPDTVTNGIPYPIVCCSNPVRRTISGLQPGLEIGVRLLPFRRLFIEAGGRFTLVTLDDPMQRAQLGDVESRLVIAAGIVW